MSTAAEVRHHIEGRPVRVFISTADLPGYPRAVECEMSRLAAAGEVIRVRKGLYWKGPRTRVGMPAPRPAAVALEVAGPGSGPAGLSAAHALGLSTQVPAVEVVAVPGRAPSPVRGARFAARSIERRIHGLRPMEVALIEVLRAGPSVIEAPWSEVAKVARRLAKAGEIRPAVIDGHIPAERHVATRERWAGLGLMEATAP